MPDPPAGHDVVFEIDVHGAAQIQERFPDALLVFVEAPSRGHQEQRLRHRGDPDEKVAERLAKAAEETEVAAGLGAVVVVNDLLETAIEEIRGLIEQCRSKLDRC